MGNHTAEAGVVAGILLLIADLTVPEMKPQIIASGLFLVGVLFIGASFDVWLKQRPTVADASRTGNIMGNVQNNQGIVTQGQTGDNAAK
jgi:hypothetical protein